MDKPTTDPTLTPRQVIQRTLATLGFSNISHDDVVALLNTAVTATYDEANDFIKGASTHTKAAQAQQDIAGSLDRLAAVIRAAVVHVPGSYANDMEQWAQTVEYAGLPEDSSDGLESWAYEIADAMAHIGDNPLPTDAADVEA